MTRVYMIDDSALKHYWFLKIIDRANEMRLSAGHAQFFESGFGKDVQISPSLALDADALWRALLDKNSIYFVDMNLIPIGGNTELDYRLEQKFRTTDIPAMQRAYSQFQEIDFSDRLGDMKNKYKASLLCLLALKELGAPAMLASSYISGSNTLETLRGGLARQVSENFPAQPVTREEVLAEEGNDLLSVKPNQNTSEAIDEWARQLCLVSDGLEAVQQRTRTWFARGGETGWRSFEDDGPPHTLIAAQTSNAAFIDSYKRCVRTILSAAPDSWWSGPDEVLALHECLKSSFGAHAQWMNPAAENPLCLGGAYFTLLIALGENVRSGGSEFLVDNLRVFCNYDDASFPVPIPFLPASPSEVANITFGSLFDFLRLAVVSKYDGSLAISEMQWPQPAIPSFAVKLKWPAPDLTGFSDSINGAIMPSLRIANRAEGAVMKISPGKTKGAFLRFALASQIRAHGTGALGRIVLENDPNEDKDDRGWLRIGVQ